MIQHWYSERQAWRLPNNPYIREWLLCRKSTSVRAKNHYGKTWRVKVISQSWQRPILSECQELSLPANRYCLIREVELFIDDTLMMTARSVMPKGRLTEQYRINTVAKHKPIGQWLFKHPNLQRSLFDIQLSTNKLWMRRSLLKTPEQKLLLTETFIPEIFK